VAVLLGFAVALVATPAGVSGSFLLLPVQVSLIGVVTPSASATNLIFNLVSTPGAIWRYRQQGQTDLALVGPLVAGNVPGVVGGAWLRVTLFSPPERFLVFVGVVLGLLGVRLLWSVVRQGRHALRDGGEDRAATLAVFSVSLVVGVVGGVYGIGGAALIAPFLVGVLGFRLRSVVGATLLATFLTSAAGVVTFELLSRAGSPHVAADWTFGIAAGLGGLLGSYAGARLHQYLPERLMKTVLAVLVIGLAIHYLT
jgi:hypothetical protein